jgi:transcription factor C subunit 3
MIQQGLIEKVVVPSNKKKSSNTFVKCFRLVARSEGASTLQVDGNISCDPDDDMDDVAPGT